MQALVGMGMGKMEPDRKGNGEIGFLGFLEGKKTWLPENCGSRRPKEAGCHVVQSHVVGLQ
jgi:hypothetical protein